MANGRNGGLVQINVAGATLAPGAAIQARGEGGNGGVIAINSSGPVDVGASTVIDSSGKVSAGFDTNVINIEGSLVNVAGVLRADGVDAQFGGSRGGTIRLVSNGAIADSQYETSSQTQKLFDQNQATISKAWDNAMQRSSGDTAAATIQASERQQWQNRANSYLENVYWGSINLGDPTATPGLTAISANGTRGGIDPRNDYFTDRDQRACDGGTIQLIASKHLFNNYGSTIRANGAIGLPSSQAGASPIKGGNGGTIAMLARQIMFSSGNIEANGGRGGWSNNGKGANSGDGGLITISYGGIPGSYFENQGRLTANGALGGDGLTPGWGENGGLILLNAMQNPMDSPFGGYPTVQAAGRGGNEGSRLFGGKAGTIVSPDPTTINRTWSYQQTGYANGRTVEKPFTDAIQANELLIHGENLILLGNNQDRGAASGNFYERLGLARIRSVEDPSGSLGLARNEILNKYNIHNLLIGSSRNGLGLDLNPSAQSSALNLIFNQLNTLSILNEGSVKTLMVPSDLPPDFQAPKAYTWFMGDRPENLGGGRISVLSHGDIRVTNLFGARGVASGGSVNLASGNNIVTGFSLYEGYVFTEGGLHVGSIIMKAPENIEHSYDAYYYVGEITSNGNLMGGNIQMNAGNQLRASEGPSDRPALISANGGKQGGIIIIQAPNTNQYPGAIEAKGTQKNGTIMFNNHSL